MRRGELTAIDSNNFVQTLKSVYVYTVHNPNRKMIKAVAPVAKKAGIFCLKAWIMHFLRIVFSSRRSTSLTRLLSQLIGHQFF